MSSHQFLEFRIFRHCNDADSLLAIANNRSLPAGVRAQAGMRGAKLNRQRKLMKQFMAMWVLELVGCERGGLIQ